MLIAPAIAYLVAALKGSSGVLMLGLLALKDGLEQV
jgi:hypothetical protein